MKTKKKNLLRKVSKSKANLRRGAYERGVQEILTIQRERYGPPPREKIEGMVQGIIDKVGLRKDPREYFFYLKCYCALLGKDFMCREWKVKPLSKKELKQRAENRMRARAKALAKKVKTMSV